MAQRKISATKDYRLFQRDDKNRPFNLKKHKKLLESMKLYGFLDVYPIVCWRDAKGRLIIKDGQHRLAIAETLGLTVYWEERLVQNAGRCREKLVSYSTRDAYLEMFEEVYNFGRKALVPLKISAITAMRQRSIVNGSARKKSEKKDPQQKGQPA